MCNNQVLNRPNDYIKYWDSFIGDWCIHDGKPTIAESCTFLGMKTRNGSTRLNPKELPEPYLGEPNTSLISIINYNPGASSNNEKSKMKCGWLMEKYLRKNSYHDFQTEYNPLNGTEKNCVKGVPGVDWWGSRITWIQRMAFFLSGKEIEPCDILALEMCPYHSLRKGNFLGDPNLENHYLNRVLSPAVAFSRKTGVVLAIGKGIYDFIIKNGGKVRKVWTTNSVSNWPQNKKRTYSLLEIPKIGWFLITYAPGSNKAPAKYFSTVEKCIATEIKQSIQSTSK